MTHRTFFARALTERLVNRRFRHDIARLNALHDSQAGRILVLIGNGPSLNAMDLGPLGTAGHAIMTVNKGFAIPALTGLRPDFHCVSDINCYRCWGTAIEAAPVATRFYRTSFLPEMSAVARARADTYFVPVRRGGLLKRGFDRRLDHGLGNDSSVLVFAAQIAYHLGFSLVAVIGCDLDYSGNAPYAYAMTEADERLEASAETRHRRLALANANAEFALLRQQYESNGRRLTNAGLGGRLDALPRVSLAGLLKQSGIGAANIIGDVPASGAG